jgi:hypothetical protein
MSMAKTWSWILVVLMSEARRHLQVRIVRRDMSRYRSGMGDGGARVEILEKAGSLFGRQSERATKEELGRAGCERARPADRFAAVDYF